MARAFQFNGRPKPTAVTPDSNCLGLISTENGFTLSGSCPIAPGISSRGALVVCSTAVRAALLAGSPEVDSAQMKLAPKAAAPGGVETRYFTSIDGLMDGNADVILKETRQGKTVTAAVLDVCYPVAKNSDRKDRFVVNLQVA